MDEPETVIAEYEELVKIKEFHMAKEWDPLHWTYQKVVKDLEREFVGNIAEKVDRWTTITNARYFKYSTGVLYYFQAKMLFRDGYYEAAIAVSRSVCEMICYDFLSKEPHSFGTEQELEQVMFGPLLRFLAVPKHISKIDFIKSIVERVDVLPERNYIKSCYKLENDQYSFKIENGRESKNLKRIHEILDKAGFKEKGIFKSDTYALIQCVYDIGSAYMHARKSNNSPKDDAIYCLNNIGKTLAYLYVVDDLTDKSIVTGYNAFPDVCKGVSFWIDVYFSSEEAKRGYINAPSGCQFEKMLALTGDWRGEWRASSSLNETGTLRFIKNGEYLKATFKFDANGQVYDKIAIRLFGDYFHLMIHDLQVDGSSGGTTLKFELEILNNTTLLGKILGEEKKVCFTKIDTQTS